MRAGKIPWRAALLVPGCAALLLAACHAGPPGPGAAFSDRFAVVFIDSATEAKLGAFPLPRAYYAQAIRQAAALHARAVVFKFFFDQPQDGVDDTALANAMTTLPVALEARFDDTEAQPNPLPARFQLPITAVTATAGKSGWIPLPLFADHAAAIGFVDFDSAKAPLLETYRGQTVKSLLVNCLEMAENHAAEVRPGHDIAFGAFHLAVDSLNRCSAALPPGDDYSYIPFHRFLSGDVSPDAIRDKVVIIGYDGPKIHSIATPRGPLRAHRFFIYILQSIWSDLR